MKSSIRAASWALLVGNFAIGCGVMAVAGSLNDLVRSLQVSVAVGGQLITVAAAVMALGAPLLAAAVAGFDRRRLLTLSLVWYGVGHIASALTTDYAALLSVRAATVLGAAVFTPQAAAAMNVLAPAESRGRAITFIFTGWSLASVVGMPLAAWIAETRGWQLAFWLIGAMSLLSAAAVWVTVPDGVRPPPLSLAAWRHTLTHPLLMGMVAVTALSSAGQFTLFAYMAPYDRQVLGFDAAGIGLMFLWFGACGLLGNIVLQRFVDRVGAAQCATLLLGLIALSLLAWPLGTSLATMALVSAPWGFACFAANSAQQARLGAAAPALAPALMALNSSALYAGQAIGAGGGGALIAGVGFGALNWTGFAWLLVALAVSAALGVRMARPYSA